MEVIVAKSAGFCKGVQEAIKLATSIDNGCVTLGKLIHNEQVIKSLEEKNIKAINTLDDYTSGVLLIRSHGAGKDVYDELEKRHIPYKDATCPFVKKIHEIVLKNYNDGKKIIIIGDKNHPEVIGTNGWCGYSAIIVSNEEDIAKIDENGDYCVVEQTTFDVKEYEKLLNLIKIKCNLVANNSTICYTTTRRQEEAEDISKKCDLVLVLGSRTSSNTTKLYNICKANCPTYLIENKADLESVEYKNLKLVGIVAGASTPQELIMEVKNTMSESQETKNVVVEDVKEEKTTSSFADLYEASKKKADKAMSIKLGKEFTVTVISANEKGISVSFGGKKDGFIPAEEAEVEGTAYDPNNYKEGDTIVAKVIDNPDAKSGIFWLSKKEEAQKAIDAEKYKEILMQPMFKATITAAVPKGLTANVGPYKIFVPSSQIKKGFVADPDLQKYVGKELRLRAIKSKKEEDQESPVEIKLNKTIYASQKVILEEEAAAADKALWEFFEVDKEVQGKVVRIRDFGAFVKVNGFECLAHKSNLSYKKNVAPSDVLEEGKTYTFRVLSVDKEKRQVSLGYKQLQKSLYEEAAEKYPVGSTVTGPIKSITNYGVYVLIEDGVDGLVPVSEISRKYVKTPADVCKIDDVVTAQVIKFDVEKNKITLSIKALLPEEDQVSDEDVEAAKEKRAARVSKKFDNAEGAKKRTSKKKEEVEEPQSWTNDDGLGSLSIGEMMKSLKELDLTND
ncbi:MAG: 4-hydroxy-3-methylbut-2-enyl diphosphate reductase [Clostridiales bacterium]|nr:4-hydroxy-3-methylbut-2-enyl diphosphate reductase [Clostridiales bacterium]